MTPRVPAWFEDALEREFRGRLRIRWSQQFNEWHVEERVGRGIFDPPTPRTPRETDRWIRARDGFRKVLAVQPSAKRPCPECHLPLRVPELKFAEVRCEYCGYRGLSGRLVLGYFPLNESLLQWLRRIDPHRDRIPQNVKEIDLHNERVNLGLEQRQTEERHDALTDVALSQIPAVGYTGPAPAWIR